MRRLRCAFVVSLVAVAAAVACGDPLPDDAGAPVPPRDSGADTSSAGGGGPTSDAGLDADPARPLCAHDKPFLTVVPISELDTPAHEVAPHLTDDELDIIFQSRREDGGEPKFYVAHRATRTAPFDAPELFPIYAFNDNDPAYSGDGLSLYFAATRGAPTFDLWVVERATRMGNWGTPFKFDGLDTTDNEFHPAFRAGGLWYTRLENSASRSIWFSKATQGAFAPGTKVGGLDDPDVDDELPTPSADGLSIYFASKRKSAETNIWFARRDRTNDSFAEPVRVDELNSDRRTDSPSWLSPDGCRLYFVRDTAADGDADAGANLDIYVAEKPAN